MLLQFGRPPSGELSSSVRQVRRSTRARARKSVRSSVPAETCWTRKAQTSGLQDHDFASWWWPGPPPAHHLSADP